MWVEELSLKNIKFFEDATLSFRKNKLDPYRWINMLLHEQ